MDGIELMGCTLELLLLGLGFEYCVLALGGIRLYLVIIYRSAGEELAEALLGGIREKIVGLCAAWLSSMLSLIITC